jgi:hypothetical protein
MKLVIRLCFIVASPLMVFMYMKNSFRNVDNIHANYELKYAE